jgi:predicted transcriptional regulator
MYFRRRAYLETAMDAQNANPHLIAKIVGSYLRHHTVGASELPNLITSVHRALTEVGQPVPPEIPLTPAVSVRQSVRQDYVVCLDCGYRGKTLRRHISVRHGLNGDECRHRWGLRQDHPLTAPAYSEQRSTLAKERGLGRKATPVDDPPPATVKASASNAEQQVATGTKPRRTRRSRSNSDVNEAASKPAKSRPRRTRSQVAPTQSELRTPTADA